MNFIEASVKNTRRIRLKFSSDLGAGAFTTLSYYTLTSNDVTAADPAVKAAYAIAGIPNMLELVLGADLIAGALYTIRAEGVPGADLTTTPMGSYETFAFGTPMVAKTNEEPIGVIGDVLLYGRDIIFNGIDFQETPEGDLALISGIANAEAALYRRLTGSPLPYAPDYSPNSREFVDGNQSLVLKNRLRQQALRDDRVIAVSVAADIDEDGNSVYTISPTFIGDRAAQPISVAVKN